MDLTILRVAATVGCFVLFVGILAWTFSRRNARRFEEAARLPFEGDDARPHARALRVAPPAPDRGQHQRPGEAGSAVFPERTVPGFDVAGCGATAKRKP